MTGKEALSRAWQQLKKAGIHSANIDAELLLLEAIKTRNGSKDRTWLYAYPEFNLSKNQLAKYQKLISRRARHEPLAYITNRKEFFGLDFYVGKNVLIPRPETEIMVEKIAETVKKESLDARKIIFIDIGTGSGCIPISVSKLFKFKKIYATDISNRALRIARLNAKKHNETKKISFVRGNLFSPLSKKTEIVSAPYLIISANLPYISSKNMSSLPESVKKYEPAIALHGGKSGVRLIMRLLDEIYSFSKRHIKTEAMHIFLEIDPKEKSAIIKKIRQNFKLSKIKVIRDLRGKNRIITVAINPFIC